MNSVARRGKALGVEILKRNPWMRTRYRSGRTLLRRARFRWHARGASDATLIVFECFVGRSYAGSPRALYEAMLDDPRYADCRFVWSLRSPSHAAGFAQLTGARTSIAKYRSTEYYQAFGRARVWISNSIIAPELAPRPDQSYVQTWHGTPLKRIGIDVVQTTETAMNGKAEIDERYRVEAAKIDRFLTACDFTTECFTSAFDVPPERAQTLFVETGNPRNDVLATAGPDDVAGARAQLGIPDGTRVVLYAPTWRDDQHSSRSGYVYRQPLDLSALRQQLGDGWLVLFRAHYLVTNSIDFSAHEGFVRDVSGMDEINELCVAADVLVTDYSSIYFDFALLDRPMVFFMYDLERYDSALRGFYLPVEDVPGPIVRTQDELTTALLDPDAGRRDSARRAALNARMSPLDDGKASRRVLDLVRADLQAPPQS